MSTRIGITIVDDGICVHGIIGKRQEMEDEHVIMKGSKFTIYGLFDGHGGNEVALYCKDHLARLLMRKCKTINSKMNLREMQTIIQGVFLDMELRIFKKLGKVASQTGSAAVVVIVSNHTQDIFIANLGDSRAVVFNHNGKIKYRTVDHKPDDVYEKLRIEKTGFVTNDKGDVPRVNGVLALSRAFGDTNLKMVSGEYDPVDGPVSIMPTVGRYQAKRNDKLYLILACDGVWDTMSCQQAVDKYLLATERKASLELNGCRAIVNSAYDMGSSDNISIMAVEL